MVSMLVVSRALFRNKGQIGERSQTWCSVREGTESKAAEDNNVATRITGSVVELHSVEQEFLSSCQRCITSQGS